MSDLTERLLRAASNTILHSDQSLMREAVREIDRLTSTCITRAEADAMVAAERERCAQLANDQAQIFRDEAHDQRQLGHREMHNRAKMIASFFDAHASAIRKGETP